MMFVPNGGVIWWVTFILGEKKNFTNRVVIAISRRMRRTNANIKIKAQKKSIAKPEVEFLGIIWRQGRLHIPSARIQAFKNVPIPKTPKKVKSFVCAMSYYRKFIPKFAELAKPLMDLSSLHPTQFKWLPIHQQSFDNMIRAIEINTSLNLPDPQKPFYSCKYSCIIYVV